MRRLLSLILSLILILPCLPATVAEETDPLIGTWEMDMEPVNAFMEAVPEKKQRNYPYFMSASSCVFEFRDDGTMTADYMNGSVHTVEYHSWQRADSSRIMITSRLLHDVNDDSLLTLDGDTLTIKANMKQGGIRLTAITLHRVEDRPAEPLWPAFDNTGNRDEALKAAFDACGEGSTARLYLEEIPQPDVSDMEVWCAASARDMMNEKNIDILSESEDGKLLYIGKGADLGISDPDGFFVTDISPDGSVLLGMLGEYRACIRDGKVILLTWSRDRSAPDIYRAFEYCSQQQNRIYAPRVNSNIDISWSPDGTLAAMTDLSSLGLMSPDFSRSSLTVFDTGAGEYYIPFASDSDPLKGPFAGVATGACFDATGRYVYFTLYGSISGLFRHDTVLNTNSYIGDAAYYDNGCCIFSPLSLLADGRIIVPVDLSNKANYGIGVYTPSDIPVTLPYSLLDFPYYANVSECSGEYTFTYIRSLNESYMNAEFGTYSGMGVGLDIIRASLIQTQKIQPAAPFYILDANRNMKGINDAFVLTYEGTVDQFTWETSLTEGTLRDHKSVLQTALSPDGRYVLLITNADKRTDNGYPADLYLCELETLKTVHIDTPESLQSSDVISSVLTRDTYARGTTWQPGNIFITAGGMFTLKWGE